MLQFINESDFLLVTTYQENLDGSVTWIYDEGVGLPTHSGFINEGFTRTIEVQIGTETIVVGTDEEGNDITEERPIYETQTIDVWQKLQDLSLANTITISPLPVAPHRESAKASINQIRDDLIAGGVVYNGNTYQTDQNSILDIMGAVIAGIGVTWLTVDNTQVSLTATDLQALGALVANHKGSLVYQARVHKDTLDTLHSITEIDNYMASLTWV